MSVGQTASTYQTVFGIAPETQPPTGAPASTGFLYVPVTKFDPKPIVAKLADTGWRGSMVDAYDQQNGPVSSQLDVAGDFFPDTGPIHLAAILGDVVTTGSSAPFTHSMSLQNGGNGQPWSYTLQESDAIQPLAYADARCTELKLSYDASKLLTYDATYLAWLGATLAAPTTSYSTLAPQAAWTAQASIGGSTVATVETAEIDIKRDNSELIYTLQNVQSPYEVHVGPIVITTKLMVVAKDTSPYTDFVANNLDALTLNFTTGAGAALVQCQLQMSKHRYTAVQKDRSKSYIQWSIEGKAFGNTTDAGASAGYSPMKATVQNALPNHSYVTT